MEGYPTLAASNFVAQSNSQSANVWHGETPVLYPFRIVKGICRYGTSDVSRSRRFRYLGSSACHSEIPTSSSRCLRRFTRTFWNHKNRLDLAELFSVRVPCH